MADSTPPRRLVSFTVTARAAAFPSLLSAFLRAGGRVRLTRHRPTDSWFLMDAPAVLQPHASRVVQLTWTETAPWP